MNFDHCFLDIQWNFFKSLKISLKVNSNSLNGHFCARLLVFECFVEPQYIWVDFFHHILLLRLRSHVVKVIIMLLFLNVMLIWVELFIKFYINLMTLVSLIGLVVTNEGHVFVFRNDLLSCMVYVLKFKRWNGPQFFVRNIVFFKIQHLSFLFSLFFETESFCITIFI